MFSFFECSDLLHSLLSILSISVHKLPASKIWDALEGRGTGVATVPSVTIYINPRFWDQASFGPSFFPTKGLRLVHYAGLSQDMAKSSLFFPHPTPGEAVGVFVELEAFEL